MANAAILVGNSKFQKLQALPCCHDDLLAMKQLLEATEKYDSISVIEDTTADELKRQLREAIDKVPSPNELFFYFTGHGCAWEGELIYCSTNFDGTKPNQTGLSTPELHTILRLANARLVVKVIDACNSGTSLIKSQIDWDNQAKAAFQSIIQFASCHESQNSFGGDPLSLFTAKFRDAALRKPEGVVFYTDIISTLRDEFMPNATQTPHFTTQHSAREHFVDEAKKLDGLRKSLEELRAAAVVQQAPSTTAPVALPTLADRLRAADAKVVTPEIMSKFVGAFFDELISKITTEEFAEFFDVERTEHARFEESTAEEFIIRVLSKETRADNFVTANHSRKSKTRNPMLGSALFDAYLDPNRFEETWYLHLNCTMERTQLRITFTPKYSNLQRITLVVTCAPSLDHCYIFEVATQHRLRDFGKYDSDGPEISQRWWKCTWSKGPEAVAKQISGKFAEAVRQQLENAEKRLAGEA